MSERRKEPCPFDPGQTRGGPCKYGERCPYFMRRGKRTLCLVGAHPDNLLAHLIGAKQILADE